MTNIYPALSQEIAGFFEILSVPTRLSILLAIGEREVCVCHLEAVLHLRQAAISQHLQVLKRSQWVLSRRQGRFVYYKLRAPGILALIYEAARLMGISDEHLAFFARVPAEGCMCSLCNPDSVKPSC